jgi:hypothetical protein
MKEFREESRRVKISRMIAKTISIEGIEQILFVSAKYGTFHLIVRDLLHRALERPEEIREMLEHTDHPKLL